MTRAALAALALLATPAHAATWCEFGPNGKHATIAPDDNHFARVQINNRLASRKQSTCDLTLWGVTVQVLYEAAPFDAPDTFHISPPAGFIAVPDTLTLDERTSGVVFIVLQYGVGS